MLTVNVFEMARAGQVRTGEIPLNALPRLRSSLLDSAGSATYTAQGCHDAQGRPALRLRVATQVKQQCDRCGASVPLELSCEALFYFVPDAAALEREPIDDTPDEALVGSEHFDLAELLEDELILALPLSPRHPVCAGQALDEAQGDRPLGDVQRPFAGLAALRDGLRRQGETDPSPHDDRAEAQAGKVRGAKGRSR
jgi:uncharacterized protein